MLFEAIQGKLLEINYVFISILKKEKEMKDLIFAVVKGISVLDVISLFDVFPLSEGCSSLCVVVKKDFIFLKSSYFILSQSKM